MAVVASLGMLCYQSAHLGHSEKDVELVTMRLLFFRRHVSWCSGEDIISSQLQTTELLRER